MWGKKLHQIIFLITLSNLLDFDKFWHLCTLINFLLHVYFIFFMKWQTKNQLIHLFHLFADENDISVPYFRGFKSKTDNEITIRKTFADIIC